MACARRATYAEQRTQGDRTTAAGEDAQQATRGANDQRGCQTALHRFSAQLVRLRLCTHGQTNRHAAEDRPGPCRRPLPGAPGRFGRRDSRLARRRERVGRRAGLLLVLQKREQLGRDGLLGGQDELGRDPEQVGSAVEQGAGQGAVGGRDGGPLRSGSRQVLGDVQRRKDEQLEELAMLLGGDGRQTADVVLVRRVGKCVDRCRALSLVLDGEACPQMCSASATECSQAWRSASCGLAE